MPNGVAAEPGKPFFSSMNEARTFMSSEEKLLNIVRYGDNEEPGGQGRSGAATTGVFLSFANDLGLDSSATEEDARAKFMERNTRFSQDLLPEWNGKWLPTIQAVGAIDQPSVVTDDQGRPMFNAGGNQQVLNTAPLMSVAEGLEGLNAMQQQAAQLAAQQQALRNFPGNVGGTPVPMVPNSDFRLDTLAGNDAHLVAGDFFLNSKAFKPYGADHFKMGDGTSPYIPIPVNLNDFLSVGGGGYRTNRMMADSLLPEQRRKLAENDLMITTDGVPPESTRTGRWVADEQIQPRFMDIIPQIMTTQEFVVWMRENDITYQARETAEAGDYPEESLGGEEVQIRVRDIATIINVTAQQLTDVSFVRSYIMASLGASMRQRLSRQLLRGSAANVTLKGFWKYTGDVSEATPANRDGVGEMVYDDSTDDKLVMLLDGMVRVMENSGERADPTHLVMTPRAWFKTVTDLDTDNNFRVWGPNMMGQKMLWSTPVVCTMEFQRLTDMLIGDFSVPNCAFALREGLSMQTSDSHKDNFGKRILTIRAQMRGAMCVFRPSAFLKLGTSANELQIATAQNAYDLSSRN